MLLGVTKLLLEERWLLAVGFCYTLRAEFSFHHSRVGLNLHVLVWVKDSHVSEMSKHLGEMSHFSKLIQLMLGPLRINKETCIEN